MKLDNFCQSCGNSFKDFKRGSEKDGSDSEKYCLVCYKNGEFTSKEITFDQMLEKGIDNIENKKMNSWKRKIMISYYPKMLKKLDRWK